MSLLSVVFRVLNKAANDFIEPRREDGHGSAANNPSFVNTGLQQPTRPTDTQAVAGTVSLDPASIAALQQVIAAIANFPASYPLPSSQLTALTPQTNALSNDQLRADLVNVATTKEQEYIHFPFSVSAPGAPATYVMVDPTKRLRLHDIVALDDTSNPQGAVISVKIGALEAHRGYAISKTQRKTGTNAGDTLTISINKAAGVVGTAILEEVPA